MATFSFAGETTPLRKTKRALLNGGGRYNAILSGQRWRPKLHLDGGAWSRPSAEWVSGSALINSFARHAPPLGSIKRCLAASLCMVYWNHTFKVASQWSFPHNIAERKCLPFCCSSLLTLRPAPSPVLALQFPRHIHHVAFAAGCACCRSRLGPGASRGSVAASRCWTFSAEG